MKCSVKLSYGMSILGLGVLLLSCSDELEPVDGGSSQISFNVVENNSWIKASRSSSPSDVSKKDSLCRIIPMEKSSDEGAPLYLHAFTESCEADGQNQSRGAGVTSTDFYDELGVSAITYTGTLGDEAYASRYFYNEKVRKAEAWTLKDRFYPAGSLKMKCFAYAPYGATGLVLSPQQSPQAPYMVYTVPNATKDQKDLVAAVSDEVSGIVQEGVSLQFNHVLAGVRVAIEKGTVHGKITNIAFTNVCGKGKYTLTTGEWTELDEKKRFSLPLDITPTSGQEEIMSKEQTFMLIPQKLDSDAKIEITVNNTTLSASLAGGTWSMGKMTTYKVSLNPQNEDLIFKITVNGQELGNNASFGIDDQHHQKSYKVESHIKAVYSGGQTISIPVKWKAMFSVDRGRTWSDQSPGYLTQFTSSADGDRDNMIIQTSKRMDEVPQIALRKAMPVVDFNLSNPTGAAPIVNTSNCYLVNAPGTYLIPLVYGNAIKNGKTNEQAYKQIKTAQGLSAENFLENFHDSNYSKDSHESGITSPYLVNQPRSHITDANLIWEDVQGMITNLQVVPMEGAVGKALKFTVDAMKIDQGNAIVAVRDLSDVMWSWHIWVTPYELGEGLILAENTNEALTHQKTPRVLPIPLGWCDEGIGKDQATVKPSRHLLVKFEQQVEGNATALKPVELTFDAGQKADCKFSKYGGATFYQHGRKDPMPRGTKQGKSKEIYYSDQSKYQFRKANTNGRDWKDGLAIGIKNPHLFLHHGGGESFTFVWSNLEGRYHNLWDAKAQQDFPNDCWTPIVKTVYDPSPVGFTVPQAGIYKRADENASYFASIYRDLGYRYDLEVKDVGVFVCYWTAHTNTYGTNTGNTAPAIYLKYRQWHTNENSQSKFYGYCVQPMNEY